MYQVIARKYRPQIFAELVNQEHVRQTLENALVQGRVAHGYIFAGQRGTGKTTVARILAKCLNCQPGASPTPCLECASCREIAAGNSLDVIEIDAASNRGIDDVRELRENVRYRPTRDRYKIFIIDEAHQITDAAFNALLKTLEEPPEWVVFMLCTTEAHKIPTTIASRCQNFTFRMVEFERVVERMQWICSQEGIEVEPDALSLIALAGDGSIRDSLSTLDQTIASFGKLLRAADVRQLLGVVSSMALDEVAAALLGQSSARMLDLVQELTSQGQNPQHFCRDLARFLRNLLVARVAGADSRLIAATSEERSRLASLTPQFSEEDLTRYLQVVLNLYRDLQHAPHPRFHLEMGLLKLVHAGRLVSIEQVLAGTEPPGRPDPAPAGAKAPKAKTGALAAPPSDDLRQRLTDALRQKGDHFIGDAVEHSRVESTPAEVIFHCPPDLQFSLESAARGLAQLCETLLGRRVKIRVTLAGQTNTPENVSSDDTRARALAHPQVARFLSVFGGQVREVRNLKETES
ncbi:MAG: DNA polymerase III subunit gamma/tau [Acidobacteria bacterium]|nr:DNA polymerase III subunit gamma/tau [Acidobacteriota bacterium]